jgi:hypothetical protein
MLKMMIMLENNNKIVEDRLSYDLENDYNDRVQNILQYLLKTNCTTCSSQNQVIKEKEEICAKVIKKTNKKTPQRKSTDPDPDPVHDDISAIVTNQDALGSSSIPSVFCNDFWGINIRDRRSHKSYRPVTILTFR